MGYHDAQYASRFLSIATESYRIDDQGEFVLNENVIGQDIFFSRSFLRERNWIIFPIPEGSLLSFEVPLHHDDPSTISLLSAFEEDCKKKKHF